MSFHSTQTQSRHEGPVPHAAPKRSAQGSRRGPHCHGLSVPLGKGLRVTRGGSPWGVGGLPWEGQAVHHRLGPSPELPPLQSHPAQSLERGSRGPWSHPLRLDDPSGPLGAGGQSPVPTWAVRPSSRCCRGCRSGNGSTWDKPVSRGPSRPAPGRAEGVCFRMRKAVSGLLGAERDRVRGPWGTR